MYGCWLGGGQSRSNNIRLEKLSVAAEECNFSSLSRAGHCARCGKNYECIVEKVLIFMNVFNCV